MSAAVRLIGKSSDTGAAGRVAIIDIGSNSIRLVVYEGPARIPAILFNEKVMAGLGKGLAATGMLDPDALERAVTALARFRHLAVQMGVSSLVTVATAAVRDAANGPAFLARLAEVGLEVRLLSGDEEAALSAEGVLAGIPDADGIVGDLGGGSLELVRVRKGRVEARTSVPLGVLRVAGIRKRGPRALSQAVAKALKQGGWRGAGEGLPFYLVGGSWRALARVDMHLGDYPLPILHQYRMPPEDAARLVRVLARIDKARLKEIASLSGTRLPSLSDAAALLALLVRELGSSEMIVSAYGLREGLLHASLPKSLRRADPLVEATREEGRRQGRFPEHGDLLDRWIAPLFERERKGDARLRLATCQLADVGWRAHPDFRAERGVETALHGNWVGVDARGRAMMAMALHAAFGGEGVPQVVAQLCDEEDQLRAQRWGLAIRLGQRLSGGASAALDGSRLGLADDALTLTLGEADRPLYGESVERRHRALAAAFGLKARQS